MTVARGGVGSNQYRTQPSTKPPGMPRLRGVALIAAINDDPDAEDVAWVFTPEGSVWAAAGVADRVEAEAWESLGMSADDARWWTREPFEFSAEEAGRWQRQGWRSPWVIEPVRQRAKEFVAAGFTEDEAIAWQHNDMTFTVAQALEWKAAGIDAYDAHDWRLFRPKITPTEAKFCDPGSNPYLGQWNPYGSSRP